LTIVKAEINAATNITIKGMESPIILLLLAELEAIASADVAAATGVWNWNRPAKDSARFCMN
jgi:hypothetical protein